jgi:biopolymer transport protein ExbB/TolQ
MNEQLTYLTGFMQLIIGLLVGGLVVWIHYKGKLGVYKYTIWQYEGNHKTDQRSIEQLRNLLDEKKKTQNQINLLNSRLCEQIKLYQSQKNDAKQNASAVIERLEHAIQSLKDMQGFLK